MNDAEVFDPDIRKGSEVRIRFPHLHYGRIGRVRAVYPDSMWPYDVEIIGQPYAIPFQASQLENVNL